MPQTKPRVITPEGRKRMSDGGKKGGPISPTNFKNNRDLASRAGKVGGKIGGLASPNKPVHNSAKGIDS